MRSLAADFDPARYTRLTRLRRWAGYWAWVTVEIVCCALFSRLRRVDRQRLPRGPWILAATHVSHFDAVAICARLGRKVDWVTAADIYGHWLGRRILTAFDTIPVQRGQLDTDGLRIARDRLARGRIVGICPEGGIRTGAHSVLEGAPLRLGAATLAQLGGLPIYPCVCLGTDQWYEWRTWLTRRRALVLVGSPLVADPSLPPREARAELTARLAEALRGLHQELLARPEVTPAMLPRTAQERWAQR